MVESVAAKLLELPVSPAGLQELVPLLTSEVPPRGGASPNSVSWSSGAYVQGSLIGLRHHCTSHPLCTKLLCKCVNSILPELEFTSVAIFQDLLARPHVDRNNALGYPNALIPCSVFQGGELWVASDHGPDPCPDSSCPTLGFRLPLDRPLVFDPHQLHGTCPWQGTRLVLAAYTVNHFERLEQPHVETLTQLGFVLPRFATGDVLSVPTVPKPLQSACPVVFEIFCGTARIVHALHSLGWSASQAVDHVQKPDAEARVLVTDLSSREGQELMMFWMSCPYLVGVWLAPPCGTASLARLIPIVDSFGNVLPSPKPLRSLAWPEGVPGLSGVDLHRVNQANLLYTFSADVCERAVARMVLVGCENPHNSLFWLTKAGQRIQSCCLRQTLLQNCAWGGRRPKWTKIAHNDSAFDSLARCCPGPSCSKHHLPWGRAPSGRWATSDEAAYPHGFAQAVASCFASAVQVVESPDVDIAQLRARVGVQPKSSSMPPLVPEHKKVIVMRGPASSFCALPVEPMQRLQRPWEPDGTVSPACAIPEGAQLLRRGPVADKLGDLSCSRVEEIAWGVPFKPEEFVDEALKTGHPRTLSALLPEILSKAVAKNAVTPIAEMAAERASWFGHWTSRAAELKEKEAALHASMPAHRQRVLAGKKLLLWQELLEAYGYPDKGVVSLMSQGSDLEGQVPVSGLFEPLFKPALISPSKLRENAQAARAEVLASVATPSEHDDLIAEKTELEFSKGWVSAALEPTSLPQQSIVNKRFAIIQNGKPRVIDDCTASTLNCSVQKTESPKPQSTDMLASLCLSVLQAMPGTKLKGKCVDLKAAYRQVPVSEKSLDFSYVAFHNRKQAKPEVRQMFALPFGASRAVYSYLRIAYSLWFLLVSALSVMVTHFFDDFVSLSRDGEEDMMDKVVLGFFGLLGWTVSVDKDAPFSEGFGALGIWVSFERFLHGEVLFSNTAKRIEEVNEFLCQLLRAGSASTKDIQRIRGRMLFAGGQLFGRLGRTCVKALKDLESSDTKEVSRACASALSLFAELLKSGPPRIVTAISDRSLFIYTDAAYEPVGPGNRCGLGGVLLGSDGVPLSFFSVELDKRRRELLGEGASKTIIFEAELTAVLVALVLWQRYVAGRPVVCCVDNNATRDVLIKGSARNERGSILARFFLSLEALARTFTWIARVPSPSNVADAPSRELLRVLSLKGVTLNAEAAEPALDEVLGVLVSG